MMVLAQEAGPPFVTWRRRTVACVTVLGWLLLATLIASRYVGHSTSPYGVCHAASGRSVPCDLTHR